MVKFCGLWSISALFMKSNKGKHMVMEEDEKDEEENFGILSLFSYADSRSIYDCMWRKRRSFRIDRKC